MRSLDWYDAERRDLPWRMAPGRRADPYRVWLSEIMLQQTTVKAVIPFYERFLERWPTVEALAAADLDDVLAAWAGLGYYSRARNLHKCAQTVAASSAAVSPRPRPSCASCRASGPTRRRRSRRLPSAQPVTPVDGNVERVVARLFAVRAAAARRQGRAEAPRRDADAEAASRRLCPGDDGPRRPHLHAASAPRASMCPVQSDCAANARGIEAQLPLRGAKASGRLRVGIAFVALREDGHVLLRRRPEAGLLGGMLEVPSTDVGGSAAARQEWRCAPLRCKADWWQVPGTVVHTFTHFRLELVVYRALVAADATLTFWAEPDRCRWVARRDLSSAALPSVMRKVIAHGLKEQ